MKDFKITENIYNIHKYFQIKDILTTEKWLNFSENVL